VTNSNDVLLVPAVSNGPRPADLLRHPEVAFTAPKWMQVPMFAPEREVLLDENVAPLVVACWDAGVPTLFSCQGTAPWRDAYIDVLPCDELWLADVAATAGVRVGVEHLVVHMWVPSARTFFAPEHIAPLADAIRGSVPRRWNPTLDLSEVTAERERFAAWLDAQPLPTPPATSLPATPIAALVELVTACRDENSDDLRTALESLETWSAGGTQATDEVLDQAVGMLAAHLPPDLFEHYALEHATPWMLEYGYGPAGDASDDDENDEPSECDLRALGSLPFADWCLARDVVRDLGDADDAGSLVAVAQVIDALRRHGALHT
jgi:hypothetical protein